jgi:hypothetical protein
MKILTQQLVNMDLHKHYLGFAVSIISNNENTCSRVKYFESYLKEEKAGAIISSVPTQSSVKCLLLVSVFELKYERMQSNCFPLYILIYDMIILLC